MYARDAIIASSPMLCSNMLFQPLRVYSHTVLLFCYLEGSWRQAGIPVYEEKMPLYKAKMIKDLENNSVYD